MVHSNNFFHWYFLVVGCYFTSRFESLLFLLPTPDFMFLIYYYCSFLSFFQNDSFKIIAVITIVRLNLIFTATWENWWSDSLSLKMIIWLIILFCFLWYFRYICFCRSPTDLNYEQLLYLFKILQFDAD